MRPRKAYYVCGGKHRYMQAGMWWGPYKKGIGWANFLVCYTQAHAIRQYLRIEKKYRQIDLRVRGKKPIVWRYEK